MIGLKSIWTDYTKANQLASVVRFGVSLLIGMILVRTYFTLEEVGSFEYLILLSSTFSFFISFAFSSAALSRIPKSDKSDWPHMFTQLFWQLLMVGIVMATLCLVTISVLSYYEWIALNSNHYLYISMYCFLLIAGVIPEIYYLIHRQGKELIIWALSYYSVQLGLVIVLMYMRVSIEAIFYGYMFWQLLRIIWTIWLIRPRWGITWREQQAWFIFTLPLMGHFLLGSGMDYLDGHLVAQYFSDTDFLLYRYGARELPLSIILINAMSAALIPLLSGDISNIAMLRHKTARLMKLLFPLSLILLVVSPILFAFFYGQEFIVSALIFNIYILVLSSRILLPQVILYAYHDNRALLIFSGIEFIVNLVLSLVLMRFWGMYGVAAATVAAFLLNKLMSVVYIRNRYAHQLTEYLPVTSYMLWLTALIAVFACTSWMIYSDHYQIFLG